MIKKQCKPKYSTIIILFFLFTIVLSSFNLYAGGRIVTITKTPLKDSAYKMLWGLYSTGLVTSFPDDRFYTGNSVMNRVDTARATLYFIRNLSIPMYKLPEPALNRLEELINIHEKEIGNLKTNIQSLRSIISKARKKSWYLKLRKKYHIRTSEKVEASF